MQYMSLQERAHKLAPDLDPRNDRPVGRRGNGDKQSDEQAGAGGKERDAQ